MAAQVIADLSDDHGTRVETDPDAHLHSTLTSELLGQPADRLLDGEGGLRRASRVVLEGNGRAEERHEPVAEKLVHGALVPVHSLGHQPERAVEQLVHPLRVEPLGKPRGLGDVHEEHRDLLALALQRAFGGEDLLGQVLRSVGLAYTGQHAVLRACAPHARDFTQRKAGRQQPLSRAARATNRWKSRVRARVEHPLGVIKRIFGFTKVCYRGLAKNRHRLVVACALANLFMVRKRLLRPQEA